MKIAKLIPAPYRVAAGGATVVVAVVLAIYLVNRLFEPKFKQADLPSTASTGVSLTQAQREIVRRVSKTLYDDLVGIPWDGRNMEVWREFMSMSVDMFIAVYNDFGNLYFSEGDGSLRQWVDDEWAWSDPMGIASNEQILQRMNALNLQ